MRYVNTPSNNKFFVSLKVHARGLRRHRHTYCEIADEKNISIQHGSYVPDTRQRHQSHFWYTIMVFWLVVLTGGSTTSVLFQSDFFDRLVMLRVAPRNPGMRLSSRITPSSTVLEASTCTGPVEPAWCHTPDSAIRVPPPRFIIPGTAAFARMKAPSSATDRISCHSSRFICKNGVCRRRPALLIAISTPPNSPTAASTIAATASAFETSAR